MKSWNSSFSGVLLAMARSTQALPNTLRRRAMPFSCRSRSSMNASWCRLTGRLSQKFRYRVSIDRRLLDIGNMRGVEHGQRGTGNPRMDEFGGHDRRGYVLRPGDDQGWDGDLRQQLAVVHVADGFAGGDIAVDRGGGEHRFH